MRGKPGAIGAIATLAVLAACNFPTPTEQPPTATPQIIEPSPTLAPTEEPLAPSATVPPTEAAEILPTFSPMQELRVVYIEEGNLWAVEMSTPPAQLTDTGGISDVRLSYDGQWVVYVVRDPDRDTAELHRIAFDGSNSQILLDAAGFDALYPLESFVHYTLSNFDFLPRTHTLLFNTRGVFEGPGLAKVDDLLAIDVDTGKLSRLLAPGDGGDFTPSPSGDQIAIVRPDSLSFVDADGTNRRQDVLTFTPVITYSEFFFYPLPVWSDGAVVLPISQEDPFFAEDPGSVWRVDGGAELVSQPDGDLYIPQREFPLVSPDGAHVAFYRPAEAAGERHLVIRLLGTGEEIAYASGTMDWKGWAPDSYKFVYNRGRDFVLGDLLGEPELIGTGTDLRWISDSEFLYLSGVPGAWRLTLGDLDGSRTRLAEISSEFAVYDFAK